MTEADRLQKIVQTQESELRRLRKLLEQARIAQVDYFVEQDGEKSVLRIIGTCIGVDEYHFLEKMKPELVAIANAIIGHKDAVRLEAGDIKDEQTGEKLEGGVSPK